MSNKRGRWSKKAVELSSYSITWEITSIFRPTIWVWNWKISIYFQEYFYIILRSMSPNDVQIESSGNKGNTREGSEAYYLMYQTRRRFRIIDFSNTQHRIWSYTFSKKNDGLYFTTRVAKRKFAFSDGVFLIGVCQTKMPWELPTTSKIARL